MLTKIDCHFLPLHYDPDVTRLNSKIQEIDRIIQEFFAGVYGEPEVALCRIWDVIDQEERCYAALSK